MPDHTPEIDRRSLQRNYPNCPLVIFWHLYSKESGEIQGVGCNDPIISVGQVWFEIYHAKIAFFRSFKIEKDFTARSCEIFSNNNFK